VANAMQGITLPAGASIVNGRETSQSNSQGTIVQGLAVGVKLPSGTVTTVFVPYSQITNMAAVQALFDERVGAVMAITG
jgi:hypothetical protein